MKKLFTVFVIMLLALFHLNAQEWLVYDMDVLPEDTQDPFDWSDLSDNSPGADYYHYIMPDPVDPDNNLLRFGHPGESKTMYRWKMDAVPSDTSVTILMRLKGDDVDFDRLCDINIRNGKWREEIRIGYDGFVTIKNAPDDGSTALFEGTVPGTVHGWHIYRIVLDVDTISVYVDEDPEPVTKGICGRSDDQTYVKFGDGTGDEIGSIVDWIAVDTSGAYAPGEGAAPPEGLLTNTQPDVLLITPDDRDDAQYEFLMNQGFNVVKFWPGALSEAGQDTIDLLNAADLVIVGRSPNSGDFDSPDKEVWNALTVPLIINSQWVARSSRINMFNSTSAYHMNDGPPVAYGVVSDPADPIFANVSLLEGDSVAWTYPPHDFLENADSATNGEILVAFNETSPLVARWDAGVEYYPGAVDMPAGPRTYFGFGNDDTDVLNFFPLSKEAKTAYLAEIYRMIGQEIVEPVMGVGDNRIILITPDERDDEQANWLMHQGFNVTKFYPGALSEAGQDTIDMLNAADLIIVGRSPNSGDFDDPDKEYWNGLTAPLILNTQWAARSSRMNMFESTSAYHMNDSPAVAYGMVTAPADMVFDAVTLEGDSLPWMVPPHDFIENNDSATNGEILAFFNETSPLFARWDAGVEYYPGAGDMPAGPRTYFGFGNDDAGWANFFPLTREAKKVYLAEICRLVGVADVPEARFTAADYSVLFITDDDEDDPQMNWLMKNGVHVNEFYPGSALSEAGQDTIDMMNAAELIIVGRSPNSGDFDDPDKASWNGLTAPLILNTQWAARSSRMNMFNSTNAYHMNDGPEVAYAFAELAADPVFSMVELEGDSLPFMLPPHDFLENADSANNGEFVATFNETSPLIVRWDAGTEYYPGAGDMPDGPRTYFGFGNDNVYASNFFPLTEEGQQVYWNEISSMLGADMSEVATVSYDATLSELNYNVTTAVLTPAFDPDSMSYELQMPVDTFEVNLTAIANSEDAISVEGDSTIDVSGGDPITTDIVVTAENGSKRFYEVTVLPSTTGVEEETLEAQTLKLYPNPAADQLYIESDQGINQVTVLNIVGSIVMDQSFMNNERVELNISSLRTGVYMIRVDNGDEITTAKFLKR